MQTVQAGCQTLRPIHSIPQDRARQTEKTIGSLMMLTPYLRPSQSLKMWLPHRQPPQLCPFRRRSPWEEVPSSPHTTPTSKSIGFRILRSEHCQGPGHAPCQGFRGIKLSALYVTCWQYCWQCLHDSCHVIGGLPGLKHNLCLGLGAPKECPFCTPAVPQQGPGNGLPHRRR